MASCRTGCSRRRRLSVDCGIWNAFRMLFTRVAALVSRRMAFFPCGQRPIGHGSSCVPTQPASFRDPRHLPTSRRLDRRANLARNWHKYQSSRLDSLPAPVHYSMRRADQSVDRPKINLAHRKLTVCEHLGNHHRNLMISPDCERKQPSPLWVRTDLPGERSRVFLPKPILSLA